MALKDAEIRAFQAGITPVKKADAKGLYIEIFPNGSKLWRLKFRVAGKEKRLALGAYPEVSLAEARKRRDAARAELDMGKDPALERKREKAALTHVAHAFFESQSS
ncbi:integrase arm-type DNA-binding domain-containing protein [Novosphingobium sp. FSY-8]|uniref:Integrase arm-type DNA-binding domain-containing protein n=1 Tax=Novosphingobium ovatum TaxID=1908523 RepID=A0ABW9XHF9_9SPHN|nr:Arm DNA-binding domain-containing protein [Novosphingobium ovatum]NBC37909.1 integrase arm-type DNA-binding domain-containing protein [Novosphingobium ovatum]